MSKSTTLITLGVLIFLLPFIGLPTSWLSWLLPLFGIVVGVIGYLIREYKTTSHTVLHDVEVPPAPEQPQFDIQAPQTPLEP